MGWRANGPILGVLLLAAAPVHAGEPQGDMAPVSLQFQLLYKALGFDRNRSDAEAELVLGIVYQSRYRTSKLLSEEAAAAAAEQAPLRGPGTTRIVMLDLDREPFEAQLARLRPGAVYVAPVRAVRIAELARVARKQRVTTMTGVPPYVMAGLSLGIGLRGDRPEILVNVTAAKAEGADFGSPLLKVSRVVVEEAEP